MIGVVADAEAVPIPFLRGLMGKNLTLRSGLVNPQNQIAKLLPLIEQGRLDPTEIITHRLPLADGVRGYRALSERRSYADSPRPRASRAHIPNRCRRRRSRLPHGFGSTPYTRAALP